jgi:hypothetical protein
MRLNIVLTVMRTSRTYLLWGIFIAGAGFLISLAATARLLSLLMVQSIVPPTFWHLPFVLLIFSCLCMVASIALMILALTSKAKK